VHVERKLKCPWDPVALEEGMGGTVRGTASIVTTEEQVASPAEYD
jgi:hypothetical protein